MVGNKLKELKAEISKYIGIPYFSNIGRHKNNRENVFVGKGTAKEIALETINIANHQKIKLLELTPAQIYNLQKKNHIGIDCSGLVYNLIYFLNPKICNNLVGTDNKRGVRRLSANLLTSLPNASMIKSHDEVKTGDLIRIDKGKHLIFVIEKNNNIIHYVHSSQKTKIAGVHYGTLDIINPTKPLNNQQWSDVTKTGKNYNSLIDPQSGDGFYRIKGIN
jgi:hypothetical protein